MTAKKQKKPPVSAKKGGPEARAEAMRLLAEGFTLTAVAAQLKVRLNTVREWRDSPAGQSELVAARRAREATFADAAEDARRVLRENTTRAAQVVVDGLDDADPAVRSLSARTLLDRVGVPRVQRVENVETPPDLSGLTEQELEALAAIHAKLGRR